MNGYDPSSTGSDTLQSFDFWILGDPYLRSYYTIHDMEHYSVGVVGFTTYNSKVEAYVPPELTDENSDFTAPDTSAIDAVTQNPSTSTTDAANPLLNYNPNAQRSNSTSDDEDSSGTVSFWVYVMAAAGFIIIICCICLICWCTRKSKKEEAKQVTDIHNKQKQPDDFYQNYYESQSSINKSNNSHVSNNNNNSYRLDE